MCGSDCEACNVCGYISMHRSIYTAYMRQKLCRHNKCVCRSDEADDDCNSVCGSNCIYSDCAHMPDAVFTIILSKGTPKRKGLCIMLENFAEWIRRIAIFYILSGMFIGVIPGNAFKKHIKMFTGLILAIIIFNPIIALPGLRSDMSATLDGMLNQSELEDMQMWLDIDSSNADAVVKPYIEELTKMIENKAWEYALYVTDCDIIIDTDSQSKSFGSITSVTVSVSQLENEDATDNSSDENKITIEKIDKVEIKSQSSQGNTSAAESAHVSEACEALKDYIANQLAIDKSIVNVAAYSGKNAREVVTNP